MIDHIWAIILVVVTNLKDKAEEDVTVVIKTNVESLAEWVSQYFLFGHKLIVPIKDAAIDLL